MKVLGRRRQNSFDSDPRPLHRALRRLQAEDVEYARKMLRGCAIARADFDSLSNAFSGLDCLQLPGFRRGMFSDLYLSFLGHGIELARGATDILFAPYCAFVQFEDAWLLLVDGTMLNASLVNLFHNSLKYLGSFGRVSIEKVASINWRVE